MIDSREFTEWLAYDSIQPGEPTRSDVQAAMIAATLANVNRDPKKKAAPFTISDFMPKYGQQEQDPRRMSQKEIKQRLSIWKKGYESNKKKGKKHHA